MKTPEELLVVLVEPRSAIAESYRDFRTSVQRALSKGVQTIMFVSTFGGDGKSTVCANIAAALTQLYLEVVLVDGDLRRPTLTRLFGLEENTGLGDYLAGHAGLDSIVVPTKVERLWIVPAGKTIANPGDLLGRPALAEFCRVIRQKCDVAIFDTSPLSACSDALSLGPNLDTTVLVVNPKHWDGDVESKVRQSLDAHSVPMMGVVLNGVDPGEGRRYGYGSGYGYGYGYGYGSKKAAPYGSYGYGSYGMEGNAPQPKGKGGWLKSLSSWWGQ